MSAAPVGSRVHHIGSTAVPGLAAKDVIDIQLTVENLDSVNDGALAKEGFERILGLADHCPPGLQLDENDLKKRFYRSDGRAANLHVRALDIPIGTTEDLSPKVPNSRGCWRA